MRVPEEIIQQINERIDLVELVSQYTTLTQKGSRYWGLCPFHNEKTPSFAVTPAKGVFYCFGCHKGGTALTFLMEIEKISFPEALQIAARKAGINLPKEKTQSDYNRSALIELYREVADIFYQILAKGPQALNARNYLAKRKISVEIQKHFLLGWAPDARGWLFDYLLKEKNYSAFFLAKSGLFLNNGRDAYFAGRLIFPIMNIRGEVIAFGGRTLCDRGPKYLNSPETTLFHKGQQLYGLWQAYPHIKQAGFCYLVEGYMDTLAMHQVGLLNTVAPLGTALTEDQAKLIKRYCPKVKLVFDADEAGQIATKRALEILESQGLEAEVIELSGGKDPAEIFEKDSSQELKKVLNYSINSFQYFFKQALSRYQTTTPEGKVGVVKFITPLLFKVQSEVKRDAYITLLAEALELSPQAIKQDLIKIRGPKGLAINRNNLQPTSPKLQFSDEFYLMQAVALNFSFFGELRKWIKIDDLEDNLAKELYLTMENCFRSDLNTLQHLLERIDNNIIKNVLIEKACSDEFSLNPEKLITDSIRRLRHKILERKKRLLIQELRQAEKNKAHEDTIRELQLEIMYLDDELNKLKAREIWQKQAN